MEYDEDTESTAREGELEAFADADNNADADAPAEAEAEEEGEAEAQAEGEAEEADGDTDAEIEVDADTSGDVDAELNAMLDAVDAPASATDTAAASAAASGAATIGNAGSGTAVATKAKKPRVKRDQFDAIAISMSRRGESGVGDEALQRARYMSLHEKASKIVVGEDGELRVQLRSTMFVPFLQCPLCKGYLRNAVRLKQCMHAFCHYCISTFFYDCEDVDTTTCHPKCPAFVDEWRDVPVPSSPGSGSSSSAASSSSSSSPGTASGSGPRVVCGIGYNTNEVLPDPTLQQLVNLFVQKVQEKNKEKEKAEKEKR